MKLDFVNQPLTAALRSQFVAYGEDRVLLMSRETLRSMAREQYDETSEDPFNGENILPRLTELDGAYHIEVPIVCHGSMEFGVVKVLTVSREAEIDLPRIAIQKRPSASQASADPVQTP